MRRNRVTSKMIGVLALAVLASACVYPKPPPGDPVPSLALAVSSPGTVEVTVTATPTNFVPVVVQFRLDSTSAPAVTDGTAPFSVTYNSAQVGAGSHVVIATGVGPGLLVGQPVAITLTRPNIVAVLVDDLDATRLPYWDAMPKTKALIADQGLVFDNGFVVGPVCCPSRATFLTGRYSHNTGVLDNSAPDGGYASFRDGGAENDTVATRLRAAGYKTAFIGKYLNGYENDSALVPPGWDEWFGLEGAVFFEHDYGANHNGVHETFGSAVTDYQTDVLARTATSFIDGTEAADAQPFFMTVAPVAPHTFIAPAVRHQPNPFAAIQIPVTPNYAEADVSDKPTWIRNGFPPVSATEIARETDFVRRGAGSLMAVDDLVNDVATKLAADGELANTQFMFTSDNGYNLLSHRLGQKQAPYEESIRVPLVISGPGVRVGHESAYVTNLDVTPTFLQWAGAGSSAELDGRSLAPLLAGQHPAWRSDFLIELTGTYAGFGINLHTYQNVLDEIARTGRLDAVPTYRAVRSVNWLYVEWYGGSVHEYELYDMAADPYQLNNLVATPAGASAHASTTAALQARLNTLGACAGASCRT